MAPTLDCWKVLNLPVHADERTLKRQYAKLLKVTRPDDDPIAFQRLREAYEQALHSVRNVADTPDQAEYVAPSLARSALEQAHALLSEFDDSRAAEYWAKALAHGCAAEFEQLLFQRCVNAPDEHLALLTWGAEERQWLTPWQQINSGGFAHQRLVLALTTALYADLEQLMKPGEQAFFFTHLERACRQGWLLDFTHRQALQVHVLNLFTVHQHWSAQLFRQVCRLFGWDAEGACVPIEPAQWQALNRRCEQHAWLDELGELARQRAQAPSPAANAAALFLMCTKPAQQATLTATFGEADWQACEQLSAEFSTRFADLLGLFPNHDPWFWQAMIGYRPVRHGVTRAASVLTACLALRQLASVTDWGPWLLMLPLYALGGYLMAQVGKWLLDYWAALSESLHDLDQRVSRWCVRHRLLSDRRHLVIRNSGPLLALALVIWNWLGLLGLVTYVSTGLIGLLRPARAVAREHAYRWQRPWRAIQRIAGLSWLQWMFCIGMIGVIAYVQLYRPGTWLTQAL